MRKRIIWLVFVLSLVPFAARAQQITMREAHLCFDYPDDWLVVSPQLAQVYAPLLRDAGLDAQALSEELTRTGVQSRAYNADFSEWLSVLTMDGALAEEIYEIERVTDAQRKRLRAAAESGELWETTGLRVRDCEWQHEGGVYWLYIHYLRTTGGQTIGRGIRYVTVHNGRYVMLDHQTDGRRFTNADLRAFRAMLSSLTVTEYIPEPMRTVELQAQIPTETSSAIIAIEGTATAGATVGAVATHEGGATQMSDSVRAGQNGAYSLSVALDEQGEYAITVTASLEGMLDAQVSGSLYYSASALPVSLAGIPQDGVVTSDTLTITGETLSGVQMQLVTPYGLTKKRTGNSGTFSFELTTKEEGEYSYTLICDKEGYDQRRIPFTLTRVLTREQDMQKMREDAVRISYRDLQRDLEKNRGQIVRVYGPVIEVSESGNTQYVRMHYNRDAKGQWYNPVVVTAGERIDVKPGDMLTVVATVAGVYEEQDAMGESVMVPRLDLLFVDGIE